MTTTDTGRETATTATTPQNLSIEIVVLPVSDVDRARDFYDRLGWRFDIDKATSEEFRVVEYTPPGSHTSIIFGTGVTDAEPGSVRGLQLVTDDVVRTREDLLARGVDVSEVFHDAGGLFHHAGARDRVPGLAPRRTSYGSFVSFQDPDGNEWVVQEVTQRIPGRILYTTFESVADVAAALRRAAAAHGEHEARTGEEDPGWPDWYAEHIVREQAGQDLPE